MITFEEFTQITKDTCYKKNDGLQIVNTEGIVRQINERNKVKAQESENYKFVYEKSSKLIGNLDRIIRKNMDFRQRLQQDTIREIDSKEAESQQEIDMDKVIWQI